MPNNPVQQTDIAKQYDFNGDYVRAILIAVLEGYDDRIHFGERQTPEKIPRIRAFLDELNRFRSIFGAALFICKDNKGWVFRKRLGYDAYSYEEHHLSDNGNSLMDDFNTAEMTEQVKQYANLNNSFQPKETENKH